MSFEKSIRFQVGRALQTARLDAVIIGNAAAALHGAPVTTQDIDLFVRAARRNEEKIQQFVAALGETVAVASTSESDLRRQGSPTFDLMPLKAKR